MVRIAIIGGGNMGEAILAGLLRSGRGAKDLVVSEKAAGRAAYLADTYSVQLSSIAGAVENAAFVILAVKPGDVGAVVTEIAEAAARSEGNAVEQVLISLAAGVGTAYFESRLPAGFPVVRVMSNTPALVGAGVSALAAGRFATAGQLAQAAALFESVGRAVCVPESQLDAVTAVSGSGPAYFFLFVEALVDAAVAAGLNRVVATDLVVRTMVGSGQMLLERLEAADPDGRGGSTAAAELRVVVTSPGGTTAAGLRELERGGLRAAVASAVEAAKTRSEQLGITTE